MRSVFALISRFFPDTSTTTRWKMSRSSTSSLLNSNRPTWCSPSRSTCPPWTHGTICVFFSMSKCSECCTGTSSELSRVWVIHKFKYITESACNLLYFAAGNPESRACPIRTPSQNRLRRRHRLWIRPLAFRRHLHEGPFSNRCDCRRAGTVGIRIDESGGSCRVDEVPGDWNGHRTAMWCAHTQYGVRVLKAVLKLKKKLFVIRNWSHLLQICTFRNYWFTKYWDFFDKIWKTIHFFLNFFSIFQNFEKSIFFRILILIVFFFENFSLN